MTPVENPVLAVPTEPCQLSEPVPPVAAHEVAALLDQDRIDDWPV
jgi:hypothetical protein